MNIEPSGSILLVTTHIPNTWRERLVRAASGATVIITEDEEEIRAMLGVATVLYAPRISDEMLDLAPNLKWCHVPSSGVEKLPLAQLGENGVVLTNSRGVMARAVADHALAMILAHARQIPRSVDLKRERKWERLTCRQLDRTTMLIIGMGAIGTELSRRAMGFGMRILGVTRRPRAVAFVEQVVSQENLAQVLPEADFVVLACPVTNETRGIIGKDELALMRSDAFLVNVGRGQLVDEDALITALENGIIGGAGLDVFTTEPLPPESPFYDLDNVILSPHSAGSRQGSRDEGISFFIQNLKRYLAGRPLINIVDLELQY